MRSWTRDDLPGRCQRCWIRLEHCICDEVPALTTRSRVVIVRHRREAAKSTGTARIAALALPAATLVEYGDEPEEADAELAGLGGHLLFPSDAPAPWPQAPTTLVVVDGTWRQARRMVRRLPSLEALPRLSLPPAPGPVLRLREATFEGGRSTLEALADALGRLEGPDVAEALHALHAAYVERVFRARGVWEQKRGGIAPRP